MMMVRAWNADEYGLSPDDYRMMRGDYERFRLEQRWKALKALWCRPVIDEWATKRRTDGVVCYHDNRDGDWTFWRSLRATVGLICDIHPRMGADGHYVKWWLGLDMAYWDSRSVYGGYTVDVLKLHDWFGVELFNDGETCL